MRDLLASLPLALTLTIWTTKAMLLHSPGQPPIELPPCADGEIPCWTVVVDEATCPDGAHHRVVLTPDTGYPANTRLHATCSFAD
jgi:hypothetical protein